MRSLLSLRKEVEICGQAVDGRDVKAQELRPDVITMDVSMPNLNGLEATREILRILHGVQILILSQHDIPEMIKQALSAGAQGIRGIRCEVGDLHGAVSSLGKGAERADIFRRGSSCG